MSAESVPLQPRDGMAQRWPRTRGTDVLAIAAVVDPVMRSLTVNPSSAGIERRWRYCANDLLELALDRPTHEYPQNRAFWATLAATLAHLASIDAPVPHGPWRALLEEIAEHGAGPELANDDYVHLSADSYEELWRVQKAALSQLRGVIAGESADVGRPHAAVPRTTNADILQLAMFWTLALIKSEHRRLAMAPDVVATLGLAGVTRRWRAALANVDAHARTGGPDDVYPSNDEFWRAAASVSATISVFDDLPLSLDLSMSGGVPKLRNERAYELKESTFERTWTALQDQLAKARGSAIRESLPGAGESMRVPRTTNTDIVQLATYWQSAWAKLDDARQRGDVLARVANPLGLVEERTQWQAAMADVDKIARAGQPSDVYLKNHEFWRASRSLASTLDRFDQRPTSGRLTLDLPQESIPERLFDAAKGLGGQIADAAGAVVQAVGNVAHNVANKAGSGFFDGFGVPLLAVGGGLALVWLLFGRRGHCETA